MSGGGYFSALGARVAEMSAPVSPLPQTEHLTLDTPTEAAAEATSRAASRGPEDTPVMPEPSPVQIMETPTPDPAALTIGTDSADLPDVSATPQPQLPPLLQPEPLRLRVPDTPLTNAPAPSDPKKDGAFSSPVADQPERTQPELPPSVLPPEIPASTAADTPAPSPEDQVPDLTAEDHLAVFERYLDQLYERDVPEPENPEPSSAPAPHMEPPKAEPAAARHQTAPPSEPASQVPPAPRLDIVEIIVTVADPAPPSSVQPSPTRRRAPTLARRRFGHGLNAL